MVNSNDKKEWEGECSSTLSQVYLPFFQLICFKQLVKVSVLTGSLTSLWPASFGLYASPDFGPCPKFLSFSLPCLGAFFLLFLALFWVLFFIKFDRVSSQSAFLDYIYIYILNL
jgi:hypothetical protein